MKKKLIFAMSAIVALFATSCQEEDFGANTGATSTVAFTVSTPEIASRAYSDGTTATVLQYAVYNAAGEKLETLGGTTTINGSTSVKLDLITGDSYSVIFWAAAPNAPYTVDFDAKTMTVDYAAAKSNDENRDAFYKYHTFTVNGSQTETVVLKRPFAQLNIGTNDYATAEEIGYEPTQSKVTVKNIYSTLNLANGNVDGYTAVTFGLADIKKDETFPVEDYKYIAMNYLLVAADKELVDVEFACTDGTKEKTRTVGSVPVQRNYRTNIYGKILTSEVDVNIEIEPDYNEPALEAELQLAAAIGGEFTLTEDIVLTTPLEVKSNLTINLNGKTISAKLIKDAGAVINIAEGVSATLIGGTIKSTADNGDAAINNSGNLVLKDVEIIGAPIADGGYPNYAIYTSGSLVVENETSVTSDRGAIYIQNGADVTINGGNFTVTDALGTRTLTAHVIYAYGSNSKLTIKDGNFAMNYEANGNTGASVICPAGATIKVYGGNFHYAGVQGNQSGIFQNYMGYGAPVDVYGGIYNDNTVTKSGNLADGYKAVESNGKWVVVANEVGIVASTQEELNNASFDDNSKIVLTAGTYKIPDNKAKGKTLSIIGTGNPADIKVIAQNDDAAEGNCDYCFRGSNVTFENVTITTTGTYFPGYAGLKGTFNNCIINGVYTVYDSSSFNNCTFNITGDLYNLWTWGGEEVTLNNCTFNCDGKAVLLYGGANTKLTVNNCTFNDNGDNTVTDKAAIEIGEGYNTSFTLTVNNATVNGFAINPNGFNTGTTLWANKNSMPADKLTVTVDGENAYKAVVSNGGDFGDALAAGNNIVLTGNVEINKIDLTSNTQQDIVIDGNGNTITTADSYGVEVTAGKNITLKNAKVEITKDGDYITYAAGFKISNGDYAGKTIKLENCEIRMANTDWAYAVTMPASVKNLNLVINNCTLEGAIALQCWGDNNTITITNSDLICNYTTNASYTSYCVALQGDGTYNAENNTLNISGCEFSYSGVDNFNSTIKAVANRSGNNTNTINVSDDCTSDTKVTL